MKAIKKFNVPQPKKKKKKKTQYNLKKNLEMSVCKRYVADLHSITQDYVNS